MIEIGGRQMNSRGLRRSFGFQGRRPAKDAWASLSLAVSATGCTSPSCSSQAGQRPVARRTHQRPRRRYVARAGGRTAQDFRAAWLIISHDRWFLDRIATHILAFEGDSHVEWFEGNYQEYEKDRRRRLGADADQPHRIKYRRIDA